MNMTEILQFAGEHYIVTILIVWSIVGLLKMPFWALNRFFRSRNIRAHGWPTAPVDADGDVVYPEKKS
jgi:hypothetical protein